MNASALDESGPGLGREDRRFPEGGVAGRLDHGRGTVAAEEEDPVRLEEEIVDRLLRVRFTKSLRLSGVISTPSDTCSPVGRKLPRRCPSSSRRRAAPLRGELRLEFRKGVGSPACGKEQLDLHRLRIDAIDPETRPAVIDRLGAETAARERRKKKRVWRRTIPSYVGTRRGGQEGSTGFHVKVSFRRRKFRARCSGASAKSILTLTRR